MAVVATFIHHDDVGVKVDRATADYGKGSWDQKREREEKVLK